MQLLLALVVALAGSEVLGVNMSAPLVPDPVKTPGAVLTSDPKLICVSGYTSTVRNVPQSLKEQVYRSYGITSREKGEYEIDHLISLELGGSNSVRNLWPESYKTSPLNAHIKDALENKLHTLACSGQITFTQAQQAIASDWEGAYVQYVGPLPGGKTKPLTPPQAVNPVTIPPIPASTASTATPTGGNCPASAPIKGNIGSDGRIYHLPGDRYYTRTKAEACFSTGAAAQAAGFRASK
jgi:hypothetical protein